MGSLLAMASILYMKHVNAKVRRRTQDA